MRLAAHTQCIDCHRKRLAESKDAGPATCGGCHDAAVQRKIAKVKDVPRLMRGQPDVTIVQAVKSDGQTVAPFTRMSVVPFNHVAHEGANDTCRACHHSSMDACGKCHTLQGSKDGKFVNLQTAMHRASAQASCVGCHDGAKARKECAGCHATMARKDPPELSGCVSCHMPKPAAATPETAPKDMAAMLLAARKPVTATFADEDIPETVEIKSISKQYQAAKMPHRKIVQSLVKNIQGNTIAGAFHRDPGTVCQGCHHNSPVAKSRRAARAATASRSTGATSPGPASRRPTTCSAWSATGSWGWTSRRRPTAPAVTRTRSEPATGERVSAMSISRRSFLGWLGAAGAGGRWPPARRGRPATASSPAIPSRWACCSTPPAASAAASARRPATRSTSCPPRRSRSATSR